MYLFAGKFNHRDSSVAHDELWTITFPNNIRKDSRVIVVFQWTRTRDGKRKHNATWSGKITKAEGTRSEEIYIEIFRGDATMHCWFRGIVNSSKDRIRLTMMNSRNEGCASAIATIVFKADS
ncbi:hypothetical protein F4604DRAFT_817648 [Suillus subluteus]|nr:hypothetical protein F4604DRAFT_817648 [Suillus subluteus]